jgi:hypothetical protein
LCMCKAAETAVRTSGLARSTDHLLQVSACDLDAAQWMSLYYRLGCCAVDVAVLPPRVTNNSERSGHIVHLRTVGSCQMSGKQTVFPAKKCVSDGPCKTVCNNNLAPQSIIACPQAPASAVLLLSWHYGSRGNTSLCKNHTVHIATDRCLQQTVYIATLRVYRIRAHQMYSTPPSISLYSDQGPSC